MSVLDDDDPDDRDDRPLAELDDERDREVLRARYYGLVQELRVMLPGSQILAAFLLTAPFSARFEELDDVGHVLYAVALGTAALSIVTFTTPAAIHRFGPRRARSARVRWSIRLSQVGLVLVGVSLVTATTTVVRLVLSNAAGLVAAVGLVAAIAGCWVVLPAYLRAQRRAG